MPVILSRAQEQQTLQLLLKKPEAQFVAVYGRRRIGKTYLIRNSYCQQKLYFECTGLKKGNIEQQLALFAEAYSKYFNNGIAIAAPATWSDAFKLITTFALLQTKKQPIIIFLDELPWLATKRSGFLEALDHVWNSEWKNIRHFKLIACGSAASWMLDNLINDKGGLHNRLTWKMLLQPFDLKQTADFLQAKQFKLSHKNVLDIYMVTGGVPYYLEFLQRSKSVTQNIQQLCFADDAPLKQEFTQIFKSLFDHAEDHISIIKTIAAKRLGMNREEIIRSTKLTSGGHLNKRLNELEAAGFIRSYTPFGKHKKATYYRIIDEFSLFYLRWIEPHLTSGYSFPTDYWQKSANSPAWNSWAGYSFEGICMKHFQQLQKALHLGGTLAMPSSWRYLPSKCSPEHGAQIDLLLDRQDEAITLFEIKYCNALYVLDKQAAINLANKVEQFRQQTRSRKQLFVALITTQGVKSSLWLEEVVHDCLTLEDLF